MTPVELLRSQSFLWASSFVVLLSACGEDGDGNNDTVWTGVSGLIVVLIIVALLWRAGRK